MGSGEDEVPVEVEDLTDRQASIATLENVGKLATAFDQFVQAFATHAQRMEQFMSDTDTALADLTTAVTAVAAQLSTDAADAAANATQIADLGNQLAAETSKDDADQATIADLNAQIAALTAQQSATAASIEQNAQALTAALPAPPA